MKNNIPILVINLEWSQERKRFMQEQLDKLGLEFEFFTAVDGRMLAGDGLKNYSKKQSLKMKGRELSLGEIGCYLSHVKIWEEMIEKKWQKLLVLEDDIILGKSFIKIFNSLEKLPKDWEMINFCTDAGLKPFGEFIYDIHRVALPVRYANRTSAYLINLAGAQKLLRKAYPIQMPVDDFTGKTYITNLIHYAIYPQTVVLSDFQSDIWNDDSIVNLRRSKLSYCISIATKFYRFIVRRLRRLLKGV